MKLDLMGDHHGYADVVAGPMRDGLKQALPACLEGLPTKLALRLHSKNADH